MQWADVVKPPPPRQLRQFGALWLVFFLGIAAMRWWNGHVNAWTIALAVAAIVVGVAGMLFPAVVKPIYMGWMIAAFPIGWTVSRVALATIFFGVLTPLALVFRARGRDALRLRRETHDTYWIARRKSPAPSDYFRQF